jgi:hypothetical protein
MSSPVRHKHKHSNFSHLSRRPQRTPASRSNNDQHVRQRLFEICAGMLQQPPDQPGHFIVAERIGLGAVIFLQRRRPIIDSTADCTEAVPTGPPGSNLQATPVNSGAMPHI